MRSKRLSLTDQQAVRRKDFVPEVATSTTQQRTHASRLLSLKPEIVSIRENLAKVAVLTLVEGFINESNFLKVALSIINKTLAGPILPLNEDSFLILLACREEVKDVCKIGSFKVATKDGPCTLKLPPWSAAIRVLQRN